MPLPVNGNTGFAIQAQNSSIKSKVSAFPVEKSLRSIRRCGRSAGSWVGFYTTIALHHNFTYSPRSDVVEFCVKSVAVLDCFCRRIVLASDCCAIDERPIRRLKLVETTENL